MTTSGENPTAPVPADAEGDRRYGPITSIVLGLIIIVGVQEAYGLLHDWYVGPTANGHHGLIYSAIQLALLILVVWLVRAPVADYLGWYRPPIGYAVTGVVVVLGLVLLHLLWALLSPIPREQPYSFAVTLFQYQSWQQIVLDIGFAVMLGPFVEESLLRGFLWRGLQPVCGSVGTLLVTSLLFALIHGHVRDVFTAPELSWLAGSGVSIPDASLIVALGFLCGWLRLKTGGTTSAMTTHMVFNGLLTIA